jgi:hypothetical protein
MAEALQLEDASSVSDMGIGTESTLPPGGQATANAAGMTTFHAPISERQNAEHSIELLRADSRYYVLAKRIHALKMAGMLVLALMAPVVLLSFPNWAAAVGALAGAWVLVGRTLLSWFEHRWVTKAVTIQEQFDVEVFDLEWNAALAGPMAAPEDVHTAAQKVSKEKKINGLRNWYPSSVDEAPWPLNVIICQRSSAVWGRRGHLWYAIAVLVLGIAWFVFGIGIAIVNHATIAVYLVAVFLPSQPAFLDTIDLFRGHLGQSQAKEAIEDRTTELWNQGVADRNAVTEQDCRDIQDQAYSLRLRGIQIPQLIYRLRRKQDEEAMQAAAAHLVKSISKENG